jgi:hypothetical protein
MPRGQMPQVNSAPIVHAKDRGEMADRRRISPLPAPSGPLWQKSGLPPRPRIDLTSTALPEPYDG